MRLPRLMFVLIAALPFALVACGDSSTADDDDDDDDDSDVDAGGNENLAPPEHGFQIVTPDIVLHPGDEKTYCYYFTIPLDETAGVHLWESRMTPGSHHMILFLTPDEQEPDGTLEEDCGGLGSGGFNLPVWTYSSQTPDQESVMPDGVGMTINAGQKAYIQMHYLNASGEDLSAHVTLNGHTFADDQEYDPAAAYVTFHTQIDVPPNSEGSAEGSCAMPAGAKFFTLSTHSHHFSTRTQVFDGEEMIFESENWEHPGTVDWMENPFHEFTGDMTYRCEYLNDTPDRVQTGDSAQVDEMCMAVGYFFPATEPKFCFDSFVVP